MKIPKSKDIVAWWRRSKKSLSVKLWLIIIVVLIFMSMAFLLAVILVGRESVREQTQREAERLVYGVETNINGYVDSVKSLSRSIMIDDQVVSYLRAISVDAGTTNDTRYSVMKILNAYTKIDAVFIFRNDSNYLTTGRDQYVFYNDRFMTGEWKDDLSDSKGGAVVCMDGNYAMHKRDSRGNLSVGRAIYDLNTQKRIGFLVINISEKMMEEIIKNQRHEDVCIVSERGVYLAGNESLKYYFGSGDEAGVVIEQKLKDEYSKQLVYKYKMPDAPLEIICRLDPAPLKIPATIMAVFTILISAFLISFILFGIFIIREINTPISELMNAMDETKKSGWMKRINVQMPSDEFMLLSDSYNSLIDYLNDLFNSLINKEKAIQKAQMSVLHEQIKPHFLYNSLETISYMALEKGADNVHTALETLGSFYRNFLSKGDGDIPLEREVRIVKDYLALQKLRYGDIIIDEYEIAEDTLKIMLPKLLLQPLVENSIYHGIRPLGEPGTIKIMSCIEGDNLKLSVYDSGIGMTEEKIESMISDKKNESASVESGLSGFGLRGTIERVRFYCDREDAIQISSEIGEYTQIDIYIPLTRGETKE